MSYILEALEKSENERQQQAVPDLQTQHTLYPGAQRSKSRRLKSSSRRFRTAVPAGLLILLILPAIWIFRDQIPVALEIKITRQSDLLTSPQPATAPDRESSADPAGKTDPDQPAAPAIAESVQEKPLAKPPLSAATTDAPSAPSEERAKGVDEQPLTVSIPKPVTLQPAPLLPTGTSEPEAIPALLSLPYVEELPASVRDDLPRLKFAGHTYSANPSNRMIIINNTIRKEGDLIEKGLKLEEITWDGVILNFSGIRFQIITTAD